MELNSIEGNCVMQLYLHDANGTTTTADADSLAVTIFRNKGGVWYSNNWPTTATKTLPATLCYGDVNVSGTGTSSTTVTSTSTVDETTRTLESGFADGTFKVKAYPNPTANYFTLDVQSSSNDPIEVKVFSMTGHMVYIPRDHSKKLTTSSVRKNHLYPVQIVLYFLIFYSKTSQLIGSL